MPIEMEFLEPNIYVFHWSGVVRAQDALASQQGAQTHAAEHNITEQVQIIEMSNVVTATWDLQAFKNIVSSNQAVVAMYLVQPPTYIKMGARAIHPFVNFMELDICKDFESALAQAQVFRR